MPTGIRAVIQIYGEVSDRSTFKRFRPNFTIRIRVFNFKLIIRFHIQIMLNKSGSTSQNVNLEIS